MTGFDDSTLAQPETPPLPVSDWQRGYSAGFTHKSLAMLIIGAYVGAIGTYLVIASGVLP